MAVDRTGRADVLPAAEVVLLLMGIGAVRLGIARRHPGGLGRRGGRKDHLQVFAPCQLHDPVQLLKVIGVLRGLEQGPGEDVQRHLRDVRQVEQAHVLLPDLLRPLFRIVVPSKQNAVRVQLHDFLSSSCLPVPGSAQSLQSDCTGNPGEIKPGKPSLFGGLFPGKLHIFYFMSASSIFSALRIRSLVF